MAALRAGTLQETEFAGSMAEAMEDALGQEWFNLKSTPLPAQGQDDRRLLFVAIAQGVVSYLTANADAFNVAVTTTQTGDLIDSTGTVTGGNNVAVTQSAGTTSSPNLVNSVGAGDVSIQTTGVLY